MKTTKLKKLYTEKDWENEVKHQGGIPDGISVDDWLHSGPKMKCIDCKKWFYSRLKNIQDCPTNGFGNNHRIKGEENIPKFFVGTLASEMIKNNETKQT